MQLHQIGVVPPRIGHRFEKPWDAHVGEKGAIRLERREDHLHVGGERGDVEARLEPESDSEGNGRREAGAAARVSSGPQIAIRLDMAAEGTVEKESVVDNPGSHLVVSEEAG
jgi:hypothetical protein